MVLEVVSGGRDWTNIFSLKELFGESSLIRWENSSPFTASFVASAKVWF